MPLDLSHLLRLRLAVARYGEMDAAEWWNTKGVLGRSGAMLYPRGLPRTHAFARARVVFAVAGSRCDEVFNPPGCATLWKLAPEVEDAFESAMQGWLDAPASWTDFFDRIAAPPSAELIPWLDSLGLLGPAKHGLATLRRSTDGRGVPLPGVGAMDDRTVSLLAAGFGRGTKRELVVPYARVDA
jgi:hypothetical protein